MSTASPAQRRPPGRHARRWLALGCAMQVVVFLGDLFTPLGFAHGVLYAPAVLIGMLAHRHWAVWSVAALGVVGVGLGWQFSDGRLPRITDEFIVLNRVVGLFSVVLTAALCSAMLRVSRGRMTSEATLDATAGLLDMASTVGELGGWRVDLPDRTSHWSPQVFRLLDHPAGEVPAIEPIILKYAPEHRELIRQRFEDCVTSGRPFDEVLQVVSRSGQRRWIRVVGRAVRDAGGTIVRIEGAIQDVERHKSAEAALERSRAEWRLMADSLPMTVWVADAAGALVYMNRFAAEYSGMGGATLLGDGWMQCVHPEDRARVGAQWAAAIAAGADYEAEFRGRRRDGQWRLQLARAVPVTLPGAGERRWYGTAIDIQNLRDEQQARARLADRLGETMESVTDAIFLLDRDWKVVYLNSQAETLLERRREDLLGRNVWDEFPEARGSVFQQQYERCRRDGVAVRFDSGYGPLAKHFEVSAYPSDGGVMVYFRDVTQDRRIAEQLGQAQRMDSLGQLTGGVAHDFNNLLTVILGNAEVLADRFAEGAAERAMADMIVAAATRGAEMTNRLLAFSRKQALEPRVVDLEQLVRAFSPLLVRAIGEQVQLEIVGRPGLWPASVDPGQLEVALLNLVVNARDAMPAGGRVVIETGNAEFDAAYAEQHADLQPGCYAMLAVSDTGHGIPPDILPRVFEPFYTTKGVGKGTGLGLAMVYGFVKQSRGHAAIYSEVDRGTTVRLYFPRATAARDEPEPAPATPPPGEAHAERLVVLLVEDDALVRAFARRQVEALGHVVIEAGNGPEALRQLAAHPEVGLLFTDIVMPGGMTGRQLADAAQALRPGLPVLYTSGYTENAIIHQGRLDPGVVLLSKPYARAELAEKLRQAAGVNGRATTARG